MALKIDNDLLDICHYVSEKDNDIAWWFDWCKDEDPLTFWERRYEKRRSVHRRDNKTSEVSSKQQDSEN